MYTKLEMKRTNIYITERQYAEIHKIAKNKGVACSEMIRRSIDLLLAFYNHSHTEDDVGDMAKILRDSNMRMRCKQAIRKVHFPSSTKGTAMPFMRSQ